MREDWKRRIGGVSPSATVATVISVATVLFLLAAGALGLGWQDQVPLANQQVSGDAMIMVLAAVLGAGLCFAVLSLFLAKGKGPAKKRKPTSPAAIFLQLAFLLIWLFVIWKLRDNFFAANQGPRPVPTAIPSPGTPGPPPTGREPVTATWSWPVALAAGFVIALVAATIAMVARRATAATADADDDALDAEDLQRVVAAGRSALAEVDEPRAAVIRSYAAMERALAELGTPRGAADTPTDLLRRAVGAGVFGSRAADAASELAQLFQRARFSRRDLPPDARYRAVDALNRIEADLRASVAASRRGAGATTGLGDAAGAGTGPSAGPGGGE